MEKTPSPYPALAFMLLALIMIPLSVVVYDNIRLWGGHPYKNETETLRGRLVLAEKIEGRFREKELKMFPKNSDVYLIELRKGEAKYQFYASLPNPKPHLGKNIKLNFNRLYNIFGSEIMVEGIQNANPLPGPVGTPIYATIAN